MAVVSRRFDPLRIVRGGAVDHVRAYQWICVNLRSCNGVAECKI